MQGTGSLASKTRQAGAPFELYGGSKRVGGRTGEQERATSLVWLTRRHGLSDLTGRRNGRKEGGDGQAACCLSVTTSTSSAGVWTYCHPPCHYKTSTPPCIAARGLVHTCSFSWSWAAFRKLPSCAPRT